MCPLPGKDRQQPVLLLVSKDLSDILPETQREAVLIRSRPKDWCSERLYSGPVLPYKPQVVAEEGQNTDAEHGRHKEKEQDVEFGVSVWQLILGKRQEGKTVRGESKTNLH